MSRLSVLAVVLCAAALPSIAQAQTTPPQPATPPAATPAPAGPPPEAVAAIQQAGAAFGQCIQTGAAAVPATVTPEAGATSVVNGCATQRTAVETAANALIATLPEAQRAGAQAELRSQLGAVEGQVAAGIRAGRATPAATPAPAPAPAQ
jgi:hypothetical protein